MKHELYSSDRLKKTKKQNKIWLIVILVLSAIGLLACITFCALTKTGNEGQMELRTIGTSAVVGWIVIYLLDNVYLYNRRFCKHAELMVGESRKSYLGTAAVQTKRIPVRGSVSVCTVNFNDRAGDHLLRIESSQAKLLRSLSGTIRVETVYGYIVAIEEVSE